MKTQPTRPDVMPARRPRHRSPRLPRLTACALILALLAASCASAGGSRERGGPPPDGPLRGEVIAVQTASGGDAELTVRQPNGSEVYVIIPARLASSIRPQTGDRIVVEEERMARDGERLRVRTIQIERGN